MLTQIAAYLKRDSIITFQVARAEDPEHIFVTVHPHRGEFPPVRFVGTPAELDDARNADITFDAGRAVAAAPPQSEADPQVRPTEDPLPDTRNPEPETSMVILEPSRFNDGVFGTKESDIAAAYSADVKPKIRTPFKHDGKLFTTMGTSCPNRRSEANCHELIPCEPDFTGPNVEHSSENDRVIWKKKTYRLGPKIVFRSRELTIEEWIDRARRLYAHGGWFASGKSYHQLLGEWCDELQGKNRPTEASAYAAELALPDVPTQAAMLEQLGVKQSEASGGVARHPHGERTCTSSRSGERPSQGDCGSQAQAGLQSSNAMAETSPLASSQQSEVERLRAQLKALEGHV